MSDERELQNWFRRSDEEVPGQPFTAVVVATVGRKERFRRLQRYAAYLFATTSFCLLVPVLIALLNRLALLPLSVANSVGAQWPLLVVAGIGLAWWLVRRARNTGFLGGAALWR